MRYSKEYAIFSFYNKFSWKVNEFVTSFDSRILQVALERKPGQIFIYFPQNAHKSPFSFSHSTDLKQEEKKVSLRPDVNRDVTKLLCPWEVNKYKPNTWCTNVINLVIDVLYIGK